MINQEKDSVETYNTEMGDTMVISRVHIDRFFQENFSEFLNKAVDKITDHIAAVFVEKHGAEILSKLSPDAIANLTIASAGAKINETLNKKMPDKILEYTNEVVRTQIYQKGIFGGLKRLR